MLEDLLLWEFYCVITKFKDESLKRYALVFTYTMLILWLRLEQHGQGLEKEALLNYLS